MADRIPGKRPHPNETSGGDLDGDLYTVCWDAELIPPRAFPAASYEPPTPKTKGENEEVEVTDIHEFFVDYMQNDMLGVVANTHVCPFLLLSIGKPIF